MKKIFIYTLCAFLIISFSGCSKKEKQAVAEAQSSDELAVYDLMEKFYSDTRNVNCVVSDHAIATDSSCDLLGVVQYTDGDNNPSCLSFITSSQNESIKLDEAGNMLPANGSKLIYLGDGKVSFMLQEKDGSILYEYTVTYQKDGDNAKIDTESKIIEE